MGGLERAAADQSAAHAIAEKFSRAAEDAERAKAAEEKRLAEERRKAEARRAREAQAREAEAKRRAEQARRDALQRAADEAEMLARARAEAEARLAEERRAFAEQERLEAEREAARAKAALIAREAEKRRQEAQRRAEEARHAEAERLAREVEEQRLAEERRKAEEARRAEAERRAREAEEKRLAEERRKAEEARRAEAERIARDAEEKRLAEERRKAEEERQAAAWRKAFEAKQVEEARRIAEKFRLAREARARQHDERSSLGGPASPSEPPASRDTGWEDESDGDWSAAPDRVTVLLVIESHRRSFGGRRPRTNPVLCVGDGCYVSAGAESPAAYMPRHRALGPGNSLGRRAGDCRGQRVCVFRNVALGSSATIQPVDMGLLRHDRRQVRPARPDRTCEVIRGELLCEAPVIGNGYKAWIVPGDVAEEAGADVLHEAVEQGLPSRAAVREVWRVNLQQAR